MFFFVFANDDMIWVNLNENLQLFYGRWVDAGISFYETTSIFSIFIIINIQQQQQQKVIQKTGGGQEKDVDQLNMLAGVSKKKSKSSFCLARFSHNAYDINVNYNVGWSMEKRAKNKEKAEKACCNFFFR